MGIRVVVIRFGGSMRPQELGEVVGITFLPCFIPATSQRDMDSPGASPAPSCGAGARPAGSLSLGDVPWRCLSSPSSALSACPSE